MNINISEWIDKYQIEQRTIESFWLNFYSYMKEEPEEFREFFGENFQSKALKVQVDRIEIYIDAWDEEKNFPVRNYGFDYAESYVLCCRSPEPSTRMRWRRMVNGTGGSTYRCA